MPLSKQIETVALSHFEADGISFSKHEQSWQVILHHL